MTPQHAVQLKRQEAILSAAQRRFAQYGQAKVTMDEIAADVGMGKASLYYYYQTKEDLFRAVIDHEQTEFLSIMEPILREDTSSATKLHRYLERRMEHFRNFFNLNNLGTSVHLTSDPVLGELFRIFTLHDHRMIESIIAEGIQRNEFSPMNVKETASLVVHLLQGLRLRLVKHLLPQAQEEGYAEMQRDLVLFSAILVRGLGINHHDGIHTHE